MAESTRLHASDDDVTLSTHEAFDVMRLFVEQFADRAGNDLLTLLGDITAESDGFPRDAAAWADWLECVRRVLREPS